MGTCLKLRRKLTMEVLQEGSLMCCEVRMSLLEGLDILRRVPLFLTWIAKAAEGLSTEQENRRAGFKVICLFLVCQRMWVNFKAVEASYRKRFQRVF